ncbi:hypothetical protein BGZ59_001743 [Podila verticillata]|nr:hypothetical protein BGZ59_001743 [Podila verticillata]
MIIIPPPNQLAPTSPFNLPEIVVQLGPYLKGSSLTAALLVNKQWNSTLTPALWEHSRFPTNWTFSRWPTQFPSIDSVLNNRHHIRTLVCDEYSPLVKALLDPNPDYRPCKILHLDLMILSSSLIPLIRNNADSLLSLIRRPSVHQADRNLPQEWCFFQVIAGIKQLQNLSLANVMIGAPLTMDPFFLEICGRISSLSLTQCIWIVPAIDHAVRASRYPSFPAIRRLDLIKTKDVSPFAEVEFLCSCSNLEEMHWRPRAQFQESQYLRIHSQLSQMHHLTTLNLNLASLTDADIAAIISPLPALVNLYANETRFGGASATSILESNTHLQRLQIRDSAKLWGSTSCQLMSACKDLVEIAHDLVQVRSITDHCHQYPWRCLQLKKLDITLISQFEGNSTRLEDHAKMYEQLSRLTELEELTIGNSMRVIPRSKDSFELTMAMGFGTLHTLTNIKRFVVGRQYAGLDDDVKAWIQENWKEAHVECAQDR